MTVADYIDTRLREFVARRDAATPPTVRPVSPPNWQDIRPVRQPDGVYIWVVS